jgi:hypothetical protein
MRLCGDNGIITNAQEASFQTGMAALEEFLQEKYLEIYDKNTNGSSKVELLQHEFEEYFYDPAGNGYGSVHYVTDSTGHALYLIKKSGLPSEISAQLLGGNAGEGKFSDYQGLNDVYGVTSNLKVWYSSGDGTLTGIDSSELDKDDLTRTVLASSSSLASVISKREDGTVSASDIQTIRTLTIDSKSSVTSLSDLYVLNNLEELTLKDISLDNLSGIQNAECS